MISKYNNPAKANVVMDALSRKTHHNVNAMMIIQPELLRDWENMGIELVFPGKRELFLGSLVI